MRPRVLLVDDEPNLLLALAALLDEEMDVVTCASPEQALSLVEAQDFDVVCTDYSMPGMNGTRLLGHVVRRHPHASTMLVTGAGEHLSAPVEGRHIALLKPVQPGRFLDTVRDLSRTAQLRRGVAAQAQSPAGSERGRT